MSLNGTVESWFTERIYNYSHVIKLASFPVPRPAFRRCLVQRRKAGRGTGYEAMIKPQHANLACQHQMIGIDTRIVHETCNWATNCVEVTVSIQSTLQHFHLRKMAIQMDQACHMALLFELLPKGHTIITASLGNTTSLPP